MENQPIAGNAIVPYQKQHSTLTLVAVSSLTFLLGFLSATVLAVVIYILLGHNNVARNGGDRVVYVQPEHSRNRNISTDGAPQVNTVPPQYQKTSEIPGPVYPTGNIPDQDTFSEPISQIPTVPVVVPDQYVKRTAPETSPKNNLANTPVTHMTAPTYQPNSLAVPPGVTLMEQK